MATKYIAHASIGENGKTTGGSAGDQTGKEVCIRTWYSKPWQYVLRLKNEALRKQFANNMIDIANNNNVGYNQSSRNGLLTQAVKVNFNFTKITTKCNTDCSAMVTAAILGAIYTILGNTEYQKAYKVLYAGSNCRTTSTLRSALVNLGIIDVYTSSTYIAGTSKAVFGDIYLKEGSHVVCYVDTGKKVSVTTTTTTSTGGKNKVELTTLKKGSKGNQVKALQALLKGYGYSIGSSGVDGDFGSATETAVKAFQKAKGLTQDGIVGANTWKALLGV